ncbi:MAG: hypothetical protein QF752_03335 [Planctomycetota bacterium]|nr:hypothetical protein [Planctomycetota bacterium]
MIRLRILTLSSLYMKRMIQGIRRQHKETPMLIYILLVTGIISILIPAIQFLVDQDGFPPDEANEHVEESLDKVRSLKRQLQNIENQLGAVLDSIDPESNHPLSDEEMSAILQLTSGKRTRVAKIFSLSFLYWLISATFFLISGVLVQKCYLNSEEEPSRAISEPSQAVTSVAKTHPTNSPHSPMGEGDSPNKPD